MNKKKKNLGCNFAFFSVCARLLRVAASSHSTRSTTCNPISVTLSVLFTLFVPIRLREYEILPPETVSRTLLVYTLT